MIILRGGYRNERGEVIDVEQRDGLSTTNARAATPSRRCSSTSCRTACCLRRRARDGAGLTTDSGQSLPIPTVDDTGNKAQIVSEGSMRSPARTT
jgi:hypothetical protein